MTIEEKMHKLSIFSGWYDPMNLNKVSNICVTIWKIEVATILTLFQKLHSYWKKDIIPLESLCNNLMIKEYGIFLSPPHSFFTETIFFSFLEGWGWRVRILLNNIYYIQKSLFIQVYIPSNHWPNNLAFFLV